MRLFHTCTILLSLSAATVFGQNAAPASSGSGPVDLSGFKTSIEQKNRSLEDQVTNEKAIVKKNSVIIEDAKRIDADNKRLEASRKQLEAQNAEFERERKAIEAEQNGMDAGAPQPAKPPAAVRSAPAPARETTPAPAAPRVIAPSPAPVQQAVNRAPAPPVAPVVQAPPPAPAPLVSDVDELPAGDGYRTASVGTGPLSRPSSDDGVIVVTAKAEGPLRVSAGVLEGMLLDPIRPVYPQMARTAHVEGSVVLDAVISKKGTVENVHALSGPMILREAAIEAIQSARYQPYLVNAEPTEVETTITIAFEQAR